MLNLERKAIKFIILDYFQRRDKRKPGNSWDVANLLSTFYFFTPSIHENHFFIAFIAEACERRDKRQKRERDIEERQMIMR